AKETGTGLGLMLCRDLIEKNKGKIWIESTFGNGTTVYFTLPAAKKNQHVHQEDAVLI
ncbi:MAG: histidine kinase, partial [Segetibacter sp.]|nr:histidine kinase [Segetibacter sp.]